MGLISSIADGLLGVMGKAPVCHRDDYTRVGVLEHDDSVGIIGRRLDLLELGIETLTLQAQRVET